MRMFPHTQDYDVIMSHLLFLTAALLPYGLQLNIQNFYFPIAGGAMLKKQNKQHTKTNPKQLSPTDLTTTLWTYFGRMRRMRVTKLVLHLSKHCLAPKHFAGLYWLAIKTTQQLHLGTIFVGECQLLFTLLATRNQQQEHVDSATLTTWLQTR